MAMPTDTSYPIVKDSGVIVSVSNDAADFQGTLTMANASQIQVKGVSQGVTVSTQGMVLWYLMVRYQWDATCYLSSGLVHPRGQCATTQHIQSSPSLQRRTDHSTTQWHDSKWYRWRC